MKIRFFIFLCALSSGAFGQSVEDNWYFDASVGASQTYGAMTKPNPGHLIYNGGWSMNLGFSKYGTEGMLFNKDLMGIQFGYLFHVNQLDASDLERIQPQPSSVDLHKSSQLLHGPFVRAEYTRSGIFAPYIGVGANLLALRGAKFDLNFNPQENYYKQAQYSTSSWGRVNACVSVYGGIRFVLPGDWTLSLNYERFLRDVWNARYTVNAVPATVDNPEVKNQFILTQKGWNQHIELRLQLPLR